MKLRWSQKGRTHLDDRGARRAGPNDHVEGRAPRRVFCVQVRLAALDDARGHLGCHGSTHACSRGCLPLSAPLPYLHFWQQPSGGSMQAAVSSLMRVISARLALTSPTGGDGVWDQVQRTDTNTY